MTQRGNRSHDCPQARGQYPLKAIIFIFSPLSRGTQQIACMDGISVREALFASEILINCDERLEMPSQTSISGIRYFV